MNYRLQKMGGIAAIGMACCYLMTAIIFIGFLSFPESNEISEKLVYMKQNQTLLSFAYGIGYLLFGFLLVITIQAAHNKLSISQLNSASGHAMLNTANLFGIVWVVLVISAGLLAIVGIDMSTKMMHDDLQGASTLFHTQNYVINALGGGIEVIGGIWVLLLSIVCLRYGCFHKLLNALGILVGISGLLTVIMWLPHTKEVFGLTQLVWFIALGISFLRIDKTLSH